MTTEIAPPAVELISLSGHPLDPGVSDRSFLLLGRRRSPARVGEGPTLPTLVLAYFTPVEWAQLNPGLYHDQLHPVHMARSLEAVALNLGRGAARSLFLQKLALLHDADDRLNLKTGARNPISPARVQVTLEWMERNRQSLCRRFDWKGRDFLEAQVLIARTDFPFDHQPRSFATRYDGKSPRQLYRELLLQLDPQDRELAMHDALLLRFCDQAGNYCANLEQSRYYWQGLADELREVGVPTSYDAIARSSPEFIAGIGTDMEEDYLIADELKVGEKPLPTRDDLMAALGQHRHQALILLQGRQMN